MTQRQSNNQWSGGIASHPSLSQIIPSEKSAGKVLASIFWDQGGILNLIFFQKEKLSTRSVTHLCWCIWRTFWRKNTKRFHHGNAPAHRAHASQKKLPYLSFKCLDHTPYSPGLVPSTTTCSLDWKNSWQVAILLPTRRSLLPWRPSWTDKLLNVLSGLQMLENELGSELSFVCWIRVNPEFGRCSLIPSWSG
jgi:hypothetical protein